MAFRSRGQCVKIGDPPNIVLCKKIKAQEILHAVTEIGLLMCKREGMLDDGMGVMRTQTTCSL